MSDPRMTGLALMAISTSAFVGTTSETLPAETFFPALVLFLVGAYKFLRTNHAALEEAEKRAHRAVSPKLRENRHAQAQAERQAGRRGDMLDSAAAGNDNANEFASEDASLDTHGDGVAFDRQPGEFVVETDVSYPVEVQTGDALADQLRKLNQLHKQGILTAEEYAVAKAKLLS